MFVVPQTQGTVLCCKCDISPALNLAIMCVTRLRSKSTICITEGSRNRTCHYYGLSRVRCDSCLQAPRTWLKAQLESKEGAIDVLDREVLNGSILDVEQSYV
ncbi:hypothetical protein V6N13_099184 [Hibiscus sabdariffa]